MNYFTKFIRLAFSLSLFFYFNTQIIAQLRPLYSNGRMVNSNVPVLDSAERASMPRMVLLEDALSIENPSQLKYKKKVEIRLFQFI